MLNDIKNFSAELIGTFFMVFIGCSVAAMTIDSSVFIFATAIAFAISYFLMMYLLKKFDCHLNPAISLAMFIGKKINLKDMGVYMIAQFVGALFGGLCVAIISLDFGNLGQNVVYAGGGGILAGAFFAELILSFIFILIYIILKDKETDKMKFSVIICVTLFTLYLVSVGLFGGGMNPAKAFALAILSSGRDLTALAQIWIFLIAPFIGGVAAAYAYKLFNKFIAGKELSINFDFAKDFMKKLKIGKKEKNTQNDFAVSDDSDITENNNENVASEGEDVPSDVSAEIGEKSDDVQNSEVSEISDETAEKLYARDDN